MRSFGNPYCDQVTDEYMESGGRCHDRKDYSQSTGLYPCNDGTNKVDWRDCKDATEDDDDNGQTYGVTEDDGFITCPDGKTLVFDLSVCNDGLS